MVTPGWQSCNSAVSPSGSSSDLHEHQRKELLQLLPPVDDFLLEEPPRWVHFPWRRCAMRILGPHGYRRLRTDRNRHKMTEQEQESAQH